MAIMKQFLLLTTALVLAIEGLPQKQNEQLKDYMYDSSDDYNYDDEVLGEEQKEIEIKHDISFKNGGTSFTVDKGTTIRLPCLVDSFPESFVIMWKKVDESAPDANNFLAIGKTVVKAEMASRMTVENNRDGPNKGSTLVIGLADDSDAGQYVCQLGTTNEKELKHTVTVRDPPSILKSPSNGLYKAHKGDNVVLSCVGKGNPRPAITWSRLNKKLPDGREKIEGNELNFQKVDRHHSGTYVCTANNGYGQEVREKIHLEVEFAPEVEVEEYFIHVTEENQVELVCLVHAQPQATVQWFKNSIELTDDDVKVEKHGHKHTLTIPTVTHSDYGNYTCRAKNAHGESSKVLEVSGLAGFADFKSAPSGIEPSSFLLEWVSHSSTTIDEFELIWRREGGEWEGFIVPAHQQNAFNWHGKHSFSGLRPATRYEAKVAAKNAEGWSRPSPSFHFATFGAEPLREASGASISTSHRFISAIFVILIAKLL